jgi:hypothetical protein
VLSSDNHFNIICNGRGNFVCDPLFGMHVILDIRSTINCQVFLSCFTLEDSYIDALDIDFNLRVVLTVLIFNWLSCIA